MMNVIKKGIFGAALAFVLGTTTLFAHDATIHNNDVQEKLFSNKSFYVEIVRPMIDSTLYASSDTQVVCTINPVDYQEFIDFQWAWKLRQDPIHRKTPSMVITSQRNPNITTIPIPMYHVIDDHHGDNYTTSPESFWNHLETYYRYGFRPISYEEFITNSYDLPEGTRPILLTFDDANRGQMEYIINGDEPLYEESGEPMLDEHCAVSLMKEFNKKHPDWGLKGIFFIDFANNDKAFNGSYEEPFCQEGFGAMKINQLLDMGFNIGHHTYHHVRLEHASPEQIRKEFEMTKNALESCVDDPSRISDIFAFPGGSLPEGQSKIISQEALEKWELVLEYYDASFHAWEGIAYSANFGYCNKNRIPRIEMNESMYMKTARGEKKIVSPRPKNNKYVLRR